MRTFWAILSIAAGLAGAKEVDLGENLDGRPLLRFMPREQNSVNGSSFQSNTTTSATSNSATTISSSSSSTSTSLIDVLSATSPNPLSSFSTSVSDFSINNVNSPPSSSQTSAPQSSITVSSTTISATVTSSTSSTPHDSPTSLSLPRVPITDCDKNDTDCAPSFTTTLSTSTLISVITGSLSTNDSSPTITTIFPSQTPPSLPSYTGVFTNSSTSVTLTTTTSSATCDGSVTYYGSVPPTVYVTVTEGFDVTVTASNVSASESTTLITPLPACSMTVFPPDASIQPFLTTAGSSITATLASSATSEPSQESALGPQVFPGHPAPPLPPQAVPPAVSTEAPAASSGIYSSVDYTSTVVVTKKTPVTVVIPPTTTIGLNFNIPTQTPQPSAPSPGGGDGGNNGGSNVGAGTTGGGGNSGGSNNGPSTNSGGSNNGNNGGSNNGGQGGGGSTGTPTNGGGNNNAVPSVPLTPTPNVFASIQNGEPSPGSVVVITDTATTTTTRGLGNIIASIVNSPFATASPLNRQPAQSAVPLTTSIAGVSIAVLPSNSVAIGSQTFAIPNLIPTTITDSGNVFTVEPSRIIAPSTTLVLEQSQPQEVVTPNPTATITTTIGDIPLTVGPTVAILSGTTYRVGKGAPATTVVVAGTSVSFGAGGVGFPSVTVAPGGVTGSPFVVYTTQGLTFSVGSTVAIVGGTTYRVGSNAPPVTTTIGPEHITVTFGPNGVGLPSTTLVPGSSPFVVVTAEGMTFSVDGTEAIISGTTYRIGSDAPQVVTGIGSAHASVSFGPGGVGLRSTTILPETSSRHVSQTAQTAQTGSKSAPAVAASTQQTASGNAAAKPRPLSTIPMACVGILSLVWLVL